MASREYGVGRKRTEINVDTNDFDVLVSKVVEQPETIDHNDDVSNITTIDQMKCMACERGDSPTGLHTCVSCAKPIHLLDGCSVDIGDEEGCGQKRMCMSCHKNDTSNTVQQISTSSASQHTNTQCSLSTSQTIKEMNYTDIWKKSKSVKESKYMISVPNWSLVDIQQKVKIGHLTNGNLSTTVHNVDGESVNVQNSCGIDCYMQLMAAGYAYNPTYKSFADVSAKDEIFEIVKLLAQK